MKQFIMGPGAAMHEHALEKTPLQVAPGQAVTTMDGILESSPLHPKSKGIIFVNYNPKTNEATMVYVPSADQLGMAKDLIKPNNGSSETYVFAKTHDGLPKELTDIVGGVVSPMDGYSKVEVSAATGKVKVY